MLYVPLCSALLFGSGCAGLPKSKSAGQGADGPWWMQQTALTTQGAMTLKDEPWWPKAQALKVGESFVVEGEGEAAGRMLVRREKFKNRSGKELEGIVWVIDDDADGSIRQGGDEDSDCYVADYGGDGVPDRMVDWIDNDGDNDADEMDIRYFVKGELRQVWCGMDIDDDSLMWSLRGYEYGGPSFFEADPYGDSMIYMNKFNPQHGVWTTVSECPFSFYDTDADNQSEIVVRISAVPIDYDTGIDPDYANDARRYRGEWSEDMEQMGAVNVRYSFDIDNVSSTKVPLHYDMGFNLIGAVPYAFPGMQHFNAKRRPPQTTRVIPHGRLLGICNRYPATQTGFTWHEQHDDTISIGHGEQKDDDYRWEGVFWIWERRLMGNTGGPGQKWNVRREWSDRPADRRELYYSEVDRRIHLVGAREGWIQVGHFGGLDALGEVRMLDSDGNGYFDRWEVYEAGNPVPLRVTTVRDEKVRRVPFDYEKLHAFYTTEVLPAAMQANEKLLAALSDVYAFDAPPALQAATQTGTATERRYAQDVLREMHYRELRQHFTAKAHAIIAAAKMDDLRQVKKGKMDTTENSHTAWRIIRTLQDLDVAYGEGDVDCVYGLLKTLNGIVASMGK